MVVLPPSLALLWSAASLARPILSLNESYGGQAVLERLGLYTRPPLCRPPLNLTARASGRGWTAKIRLLNRRKQRQQSLDKEPANLYPKTSSNWVHWGLARCSPLRPSDRGKSGVVLASGGARTHNLWLRRPTLYPVELRMRQVWTIGSVRNAVNKRTHPRLIRNSS